MGRGSAIGIDDDLAAGQASVAVRTADHELAGWIDVELVLRAHPALREAVKDVGPDDFAHVLLRDVLGVLG